MPIKLSVVIPVYKVEKFLEKCVNSVIEQEPFKRGEVEVVLVDDGSPDGSGEICDRLSAENENVKVCHQKNGGLSKARNTGIENSNAEYLQFLDSDDYLLPNSLENILTALENEPDVLILQHIQQDFNTEKTYDGGCALDGETVSSLKGEELLSYLTTGRVYNWYAWLNVVKKSYLTENGMYFTEGRCYEDVLWTQPLLYNAKKVLYTEFPAYCYIVNRSDSITKHISEKNYADKIYCMDFTVEFCRKNGFSEENINKMTANLSQIYVSLLAENRLLEKSVQKRYFAQLKKYFYCLKYSVQRYKRILYMLGNFMGIKGIALILYLRAQYVRKKNEL